MRKSNVLALLTLGVAAVFLLGAAPTAEAELICKKFQPSGPKVCYEVTTGSVVCDIIAQGVAAKLAKDCDGTADDPDCWIVITCSVYGTLDPYTEYPDYQQCGVDGSFLYDGFDETCLVEGEAICYNPQFKYNANGTAFNLPGPLTSVASSTTCESGGICTSSTTVQAQDDYDICNNNWTLDFTPTEFFGELGFCPGGFDSAGTCCESNKRRGGLCEKPYQRDTAFEGQPGYIRTFCELPDGAFDPEGFIKKGVPYSCTDIQPDSGS